MKIKFFAVAACLVMGLSLSAQTSTDKKDKGPRVGCPIEQMTKELNLTDKQQSEIKAIFEARMAEFDKNREAMKEKKEEMKANRETMKAEMEKQRAEDDAKIKAILTTEQYTKYQELQKNRPERPGKGDKKGGDKKECKGNSGSCCKESK